MDVYGLSFGLKQCSLIIAAYGGPHQKLVPIGLVRKSAYEEVIIAFNQSGNLHTPVASWIK